MKLSPLVQRILAEIKQKIVIGELPVGSHLTTQGIADSFMVSRSPAREALNILKEQGFVEQQKNRGFFVLPQEFVGEHIGDEVMFLEDSAEYYRLAEDWLNDRIPAEVTELFLRQRYGLTKFQIIDILNRAARVGWAEPKPGYGWRFLNVAKTPESLEQIYRVRALIEPAALLEPTFQHNSDVINKLKKSQQELLDGDIEKIPADVLMKTGISFHEELVKLSGNPFYSMIITQLSNMRRLIEYRSMIDRERLYRQSQEHLNMLNHIEKKENLEAAQLMKTHLSGAFNLKSPILKLRDGFSPKRSSGEA